MKINNVTYFSLKQKSRIRMVEDPNDIIKYLHVCQFVYILFVYMALENIFSF